MAKHWQVISLKQACQLDELGINQPSESIWDEHIEQSTWHLQNKGVKYGQDTYNAYNLAEIGVLLGYSFVKSDVKEAADQLIQELQVGSVTAKDCNERLKEANKKF